MSGSHGGQQVADQVSRHHLGGHFPYPPRTPQTRNQYTSWCGRPSSSFAAPGPPRARINAGVGVVGADLPEASVHRGLPAPPGALGFDALLRRHTPMRLRRHTGIVHRTYRVPCSTLVRCRYCSRPSTGTATCSRWCRSVRRSARPGTRCGYCARRSAVPRLLTVGRLQRVLADATVSRQCRARGGRGPAGWLGVSHQAVTAGIHGGEGAGGAAEGEDHTDAGAAARTRHPKVTGRVRAAPTPSSAAPR